MLVSFIYMKTIRTLRKDKLSEIKKAIYNHQRDKRGKSLDKKVLNDEVIEREVEAKKRMDNIVRRCASA